MASKRGSAKNRTAATEANHQIGRPATGGVRQTFLLRPETARRLRERAAKEARTISGTADTFLREGLDRLQAKDESDAKDAG